LRGLDLLLDFRLRPLTLFDGLLETGDLDLPVLVLLDHPWVVCRVHLQLCLQIFELLSQTIFGLNVKFLRTGISRHRNERMKGAYVLHFLEVVLNVRLSIAQETLADLELRL
jgi:hypothetical protein